MHDRRTVENDAEVDWGMRVVCKQHARHLRLVTEGLTQNGWGVLTTTRGRRQKWCSAVTGLAHSDCVLRHHHFVQLWSDVLPTKTSNCSNSWPSSNADLAARRRFPDQLLLSNIDCGCVMIHRRCFALILRIRLCAWLPSVQVEVLFIAVAVSYNPCLQLRLATIHRVWNIATSV